MAKHHTKQREDVHGHDPTLWLWPAGNWVLPVYWLTVLVLAGLIRWLG
jgi:hypothetical protein